MNVSAILTYILAHVLVSTTSGANDLTLKLLNAKLCSPASFVCLQFGVESVAYRAFKLETAASYDPKQERSDRMVTRGHFHT